METTLETAVRPWGSYSVLSDADDDKVKRITVLPGRRLSYQRHERPDPSTGTSCPASAS